MNTLMILLSVLSSAPSQKASPIPDVPVRTQEGAEVHFYRDLVKGKTVLINFMYAHCRGWCPMQTRNLVKVQRELQHRLGHEVTMISISLDPEEDTPAVLRGYADAAGVKPGWLFLTGKRADIERLRRALGFVDPDPKVDRDRSQHLGIVLLGDDAHQRWSGMPALSTPKVIVDAIERLNPGSAGSVARAD
jgi:protein SCO1/2